MSKIGHTNNPSSATIKNIHDGGSNYSKHMNSNEVELVVEHINRFHKKSNTLSPKPRNKV